jgi:hypothetical protein
VIAKAAHPLPRTVLTVAGEGARAPGITLSLGPKLQIQNEVLV